MSSEASIPETLNSSVGDQIGLENTSATAPPNNEGTKEANKKRKKTTSSVWLDMTAQVINNERKGVCNHCGEALSLNSEGTTSHLKRHVNKCPVRKSNMAKEAGEEVTKEPLQSLLSFSHNCFDGSSASLSTYKYDEEKVKDITAMMIMVHEYAFMVAEHDLFRMYSKALNPRYKPFSRQTIRDHCVTIYEREKQKLKLFLASVGRISLTSDLWSSNQTKGYMCITAHYVDVDWKIQCRILNFCEFPPPHTGVAISDFIYKCLTEWGIEEKVCTITFDNASSNNVAVRRMRDNLQGTLLLQGLIFHVRCCAHVINLIVQDGLARIKSIIENVCETAKYIDTPARLSRFNEIVKRYKLENKQHSILDVATRWNSTYEMLKVALIYKDVFPEFKSREPDYNWLPSEEDWEKAAEVCEFLAIFNDATKVFSGRYYPTCNLFFAEVWKIRQILDAKSLDEREWMKKMVTEMRQKFDKYWEECDLLMEVAAVLDPRYKLKIIQYVFAKLYKNEDEVEVGEESAKDKVKVVSDALYTIYEEYVSKDQQYNIHNVRSGMTGTSSSDSSNTRSEFEMWVLSSSSVSSSGKSELDIYLEEGILMGSDGSFDVLEWWKANTLKFPILSKMPRDFLSIPATTVASESAFSTGRRVISDDRSSLNPETVEALLCGSNWLRADLGLEKRDK